MKYVSCENAADKEITRRNEFLEVPNIIGLMQAKFLVLDSLGFLILQNKINIVEFQQVSFLAA